LNFHADTVKEEKSMFQRGIRQGVCWALPFLIEKMRKNIFFEHFLPYKLLSLVIFFICTTGIWAGDTATFVDLGFSPDGKTYMFGQYGVQSETLRPWADLFIVDVPRNNFVNGGRLSYVHDGSAVAGQDGSGALYRLIAQNAAMAERYRINYCLQGQPLFIAMNSEDSLGIAGQIPIVFKDFESGADYRASLVSYVEGSGANLKSSFFINLERTARNGSKKVYTVGNPQIKRPLVASYRIKKVMIAPHDGSMIFLIEMKRLEGGSFNIRYMVEALRL
jgi:predicted secreted protein